MLMPKKNRVAIYEHLFKEGVMVAEKDFHAAKHPELETIPNLQVSLVDATPHAALLYCGDPHRDTRPAFIRGLSRGLPAKQVTSNHVFGWF